MCSDQAEYRCKSLAGDTKLPPLRLLPPSLILRISCTCGAAAIKQNQVKDTINCATFRATVCSNRWWETIRNPHPLNSALNWFMSTVAAWKQYSNKICVVYLWLQRDCYNIKASEITVTCINAVSGTVIYFPNLAPPSNGLTILLISIEAYYKPHYVTSLFFGSGCVLCGEVNYFKQSKATETPAGREIISRLTSILMSDHSCLYPH